MTEDDFIPIGMTEIAALAGVPIGTVTLWAHRGKLPEREWTVGGRPAWRKSTVLAWLEATGRPVVG